MFEAKVSGAKREANKKQKKYMEEICELLGFILLDDWTIERHAVMQNVATIIIVLISQLNVLFSKMLFLVFGGRGGRGGGMGVRKIKETRFSMKQNWH